MLLLTMALFIASLGIFSLTANAAANEPLAVNISAEATDVYWYVHSGKLLLSSEQGNSGFYKWSKEDIAEVVNAAGVPWNSSRDDITSVIIYDTIAPPSTAFWFQDTNLTSFSANVGDTVYYTEDQTFGNMFGNRGNKGSNMPGGWSEGQMPGAGNGSRPDFGGDRSNRGSRPNGS